MVATATLALQTQLATNDIPAALDAVEAITEERPRTAVLKGRTNYACLLKVRDAATPDQGALISAGDLAATIASAPLSTPESVLGAEVLALREWAEEQAASGGLADRDDAPSHTDRAWQQVSIPVRECLGPQRCPYGSECLVEQSRDEARSADLVVTNHALLAINAMHGGTALPEHDAVIIDEAHELVSRVTGAASAELSPQQVERVGKRAVTYLEDDVALELLESADALRGALDAAPLERVEDPDSEFVRACGRVRAAARAAVSALSGSDDRAEPEKRQAAAAVKEVFDIAERMAGLSEHDVVWVADRERFGREAHVAPLTVAGLMRARIFGERTHHPHLGHAQAGRRVRSGGPQRRVANRRARRRRAGPDARLVGADRSRAGGEFSGRVPGKTRPSSRSRGAGSTSARRSTTAGRESCTSPVGCRPRAGTGCPKRPWPRSPSSSGPPAGGPLGLFSSRRAAETAAVHVRKQLPALTILCQGDAQLPELTRRFVAEREASLFGTLSLWQGVDVPGETCQLVIIDRIPFPRPDEPLLMARQRAVAEAGGNGFMTVAATHAALLLAQGSGRLIRRLTDRGVVAVLDPRLVTARYGSFLKTSMPDMWPTTDREVAIQALRRLSGQA